MGVELDYHRPGTMSKLFQEGQDADMIAGDPECEIALCQNRRCGLPPSLPPQFVLSKRIETQLAYLHIMLIGMAARRLLFASIVGQHLTQRITQKLRASPRASAAKQIERDQHGVRCHKTTSCAADIIRYAELVAVMIEPFS